MDQAGLEILLGRVKPGRKFGLMALNGHPVTFQQVAGLSWLDWLTPGHTIINSIVIQEHATANPLFSPSFHFSPEGVTRLGVTELSKLSGLA